MGETDTSTQPTPVASAAPPAAPAAPAAPVAPTAPAAPAGGAEPGAAPWASKLAERFPDGQQFGRADFDGYLRETVQPYVTGLEQQYGQVNSVWDRLWSEETSLETYLSLTEAAYGPEAAMAVAQALGDKFGQGAPGEPAAAGNVEDTSVPPDFEGWLREQPTEMQPILRKQYEDEEDRKFDEDVLKPAYKTDWTTQYQDGALFASFVVSADGNLNQALQMWGSQMKPAIEANPAAFGFQVQEPADPAAAAAAAAQAAAAATAATQPGQVPGRVQATAPVVLGTGAATVGSTAPPTVVQGNTLDQAVDDFFAELHGKGDGTANGLI